MVMLRQGGVGVGCRREGRGGGGGAPEVLRDRSSLNDVINDLARGTLAS